MAKWTPVDYPVGPLAGPAADADRPAPTSGSGTDLTHPLTLLLKGAGALQDVMGAAPAAPIGAMTPPAVRPMPGAAEWLPMAMPAPAPPVPTAGPEIPDANNDLFGQFIRAGMRGTGLPPDQADRVAGIFRLFADKAWRENSLIGTAVTNLESGVNESPEALRKMPVDFRGRFAINTPGIKPADRGANVFDIQPPDIQAQIAQRHAEKKTAYENDRAMKEAQTKALGPLSPAEQAISIISSLVGGVLSPESAVGPTRAAYSSASTLGKMALGAGTNAAVAAPSDLIAQDSAVARGDRKEINPAETALATGGAAALGALIPGIAALFRRAGALKPGVPGNKPDVSGNALDGEIIPPAPPGTPRLAPPEPGTPVRSPDLPDTRVRMNPNAPKELPAPVRQIEGDAPQRISPPDYAPRRMDDQRALPAPERPAEPAKQPAIETPRAQPEVRVDADGATIIRLPPPAEKPATKPVAEAPAVEAPRAKVEQSETDDAFLARIRATKPGERTQEEIARANQITRARDAKIAADEKAKIDAAEARLNEFLGTKTPLAAGLSSKALKKQRVYKGEGETAYRYIEREVDAGRTITRGADGRRRLTDERGTYFEEGTSRGITKQEMDYAEYLIARRNSSARAPETSRSSLDNQGTMRDGAPMQEAQTLPIPAEPNRREVRLAKNEEMRAANKARLEENAKLDRAPMQTVVMSPRGPEPPPAGAERNIVHEVGDYYVYRMSDGYEVRRNTNTHSVSDSKYARTDDGLSIAKARADYLARDKPAESFQNVKRSAPENETIRAADQPPDIPDYLKRTPAPMKEGPKPSEPPEPITAPSRTSPADTAPSGRQAQTNPAAPEKGVAGAEVPKKPKITRDLKNKPIAEQAAHHRATNPKTYNNTGPATEKALAEYFTPGRIVKSYGGKDRVLGFDWNGGRWSARVESVNPKTGEEIKPGETLGRTGERAHSTAPTWREVDATLRDPLNAPKPAAEPKPDAATHPFSSPPDKPVDLNLGLPVKNAVIKAVGPELIGALVGGGLDHWNEYGYPGLTVRGMIGGAAAIAAIRHRMPGLAKPVFGKASYAKDVLGAAGDAIGKTRMGRWFHPTMGLPKDLWDRIVVQTGVETRNMQDAAKAVATHIRENFTPAERALMSDWIERAEQQAHGMTAFRAADARTQAQADALSAKADEIGQKLVDVGMLDKQAYESLKGAYLHRYYLPKQVADPGFREAAKRMQATATYAMRRGESAEFDGKGLRVGDTAVQWTHAGTGNVTYRAAGTVPGADWFPSKEFKVESVKDGRAIGHRDYTPAEREAMGEIRDANYRYTMGMMEASRDVALGSMFKDIAQNPTWASGAARPDWVQVPTTNVQGTGIKKFGALAGKYVDPKVWSALDVVRKPWTNTDTEWLNNLTRSYTKLLGLWKIGKTAYNPATHFNNLMGNTTLSMLTGEATPAYLMRGLGEFRKAKRGGSAVIDEAKAAGLSLEREAHLGDALDNLKADVGITTGMDPRSGWMKFADWYTNNAIVRAYQHEDSMFKLASYMKNRAEGLDPREAVAKTHKVFFDYGDVPIGVQFVRDTYAPFFTYTYKYGQLLASIVAEKPWALLAAFGTLTAAHQMSYYQLYGERAKANADYEAELQPKWLEGRSGFGAPKGIRLPWNEKDTVTGEDRSQFLNSRYMIPGGDFLDFTANGSFGPPVFPQMLGNTILGGNPLVNFAYSALSGKDSYFDKSIYPYKDPVNAGELAADAATIIRFAAAQALPPTLFAVPDKIGNAAVGEGALPRGWMSEAMGWTGTDFAGRQRSIVRAIGSALGIKVEDVNTSENLDFKEAEAKKGDRDANTDVRRAYNNESVTDTRRQNLEKSAEDRAQKSDAELERIYKLKKAAGR